jgi:uncharacterized tellurite resistance protein B-like protein
MSLLRWLGVTPDGPDSDKTLDDETDTMRRIATELETLPEERARYLAAFAYILGRVAYADASVSPRETTKMQEIVQTLGHLPQAQAVLVVEIAKSQVRLLGGTEDFLVSRRFREMATRQQRLELLECVFAVTAADDSVTVVEEGQARQISKELRLSHDDFIAARSGYHEHLEALKSLRRKQAAPRD